MNNFKKAQVTKIVVAFDEELEVHEATIYITIDKDGNVEAWPVKPYLRGKHWHNSDIEYAYDLIGHCDVPADFKPAIAEV